MFCFVASPYSYMFVGFKLAVHYILIAEAYIYIYMVSIGFYIEMKKAYCVTLDKELVDEVRETPYISLSGLVNRLLQEWLEENKNE